MQCNLSLPTVDELTEVLVNERAENNVEYFKNKMKEVALGMLQANRNEISAIKGEYTALRFNPDSGHGDYRYEQFKTAMSKDKEISDKIKEVKEVRRKKSEIFGKTNVRIYDVDQIAEYSKKIVKAKEEVNACDTLIDLLSESRLLLQDTYPVARLIESKNGISMSRVTAFDSIISACDNAFVTFSEVESKILSYDMPLHKMPYIVEKTLSNEGITPDTDSVYANEVFQWLKDKESDEFWFKLFGIVVPLGLALACFIPGIGVGAVIALGALGAGAGAGFAIVEFEEADDLYDAANASEVGSAKLVDVDQAKEAYVWGVIGLALSAVDIFLSTRAVVSLAKVTTGLDGVYGAKRIISKLDEATLRKLSKLGSENMVRLVNITDDVSEITNVLNKISKLSSDKIDDVICILAQFEGQSSAEIISYLNKFDEVDNFLNLVNYVGVDNLGSKLDGLNDVSYIQLVDNLNTLNNAEKAKKIVNGLDNKGIRNLASIDNADESLKVMNFYENVETNICLLNSIDDYKKLNNVAEVVQKYDFIQGKSFDEIETIFKNWKSRDRRSIEEIAILLRERPDPPRVIARVQGSNYSTFSNKATTFVADPNELIGLDVDGVAKKLGFDDDYRAWLKRNPSRGLYIDLVEAPPNAVVERISWDTAKGDFKRLIESGDKKLLRDLKQIKSLKNADNTINMNKLDAMIEELANTPLDKRNALDDDVLALQKQLEYKLGTNELFTGQAYTADYQYNMGAREWGLRKPDVGLELDDMIDAGYKIKRINLVGDKVYPVLLDHSLLHQ